MTATLPKELDAPYKSTLAVLADDDSITQHLATARQDLIAHTAASEADLIALAESEANVTITGEGGASKVLKARVRDAEDKTVLLKARIRGLEAKKKDSFLKSEAAKDEFQQILTRWSFATCAAAKARIHSRLVSCVKEISEDVGICRALNDPAVAALQKHIVLTSIGTLTGHDLAQDINAHGWRRNELLVKALDRYAGIVTACRRLIKSK